MNIVLLNRTDASVFLRALASVLYPPLEKRCKGLLSYARQSIHLPLFLKRDSIIHNKIQQRRMRWHQ